MNRFEQALWAENTGLKVAGVDEAGRGPLAGPVVAAAVLFDRSADIPAGINDSKKLSPGIREKLYDRIYECSQAIGIGIVDQHEIDEINILQATFRAMKTAIEQLPVTPDHLLIDGNKAPELDIPYTTIIRGDAKSYSIAAASIIAKVTRDRIMTELDTECPQYCFKNNKGYATTAHINAISVHGVSRYHRMTFCRKFITPQMKMAF